MERRNGSLIEAQKLASTHIKVSVDKAKNTLFTFYTYSA
jgi:hypothetical protein